MRVLGFGTYDARVHPRAGILLDGLRAHGDDVTEVNAPLGLDTAARVAMLRQPWRLPVLALRLLVSWSRLIHRCRRLPWRPEVVLVGYLGHFDVLLARRLFPRTPIVLDHLISAADTALDRGEGGSVRQRLLAALDRAALGSADVVVVDTDEHADLLPPRHRGKAVVVPVGAPAEWFRRGPPAAAPIGSPLRVLFFGLFTPLQGTPVIGRALGLLADGPGVSAVMVGNGQDHEECRAAASANRRVQWHSWVPPADLPAVAADSDVCLGVFGTTPKAQRVVPNKIFQGAAAGCALVTSDTPPQRRLLADAACYVPAGDEQALADTLRRLAADPGRVAELRAAAAELAESAFRPAAVVQPMRSILLSRAGADWAAMTPQLPPLSLNAWLRWDVVRRLLPPDARSVLEVGCGQGAAGARLAAAGLDYLGVEPDAASHATAAERIQAVGRGEVLHGTTAGLVPTRRFDLLCAFEVLEHIEDDSGALADWRERIRPGGWLLLSVPAHARRFAAADEHVGHFRRYDPSALETLLRRSGFDDVTIVQYGMPLGYLLEGGRNALARRSAARAAAESVPQRTGRSGRWFQPGSAAMTPAFRLATGPFRLTQRAFPRHGTGLVVRARRRA